MASVVGDCHAGARVQHRSRVRRDPDQPNLRQVHLMADELLDELRAEGHDVARGSLGENVTTRGVPCSAWPPARRCASATAPWWA